MAAYDPFGTKYSNKTKTRHSDRTITLGAKDSSWRDLFAIHNNSSGDVVFAFIEAEHAKELATKLLDQFDLTEEFVQENTPKDPHPEFDGVRNDLKNNPWPNDPEGQVAFWRHVGEGRGWDLQAFDDEFGHPQPAEPEPAPKTRREIWDETWAALPIGGKFHFSDHPEKTHVKISDKKYFHEGGHGEFGFTPKIEDQRSLWGSYTIVPKQ